MTRRTIAALASALATALFATSATGDAARLELRLPEAVSWSGVPAAAADGTTAAIMYPAPNALAGLLAVLTHGALVSSTRSAEQRRHQQDADKVLEPFQKALSEWTPRALADAALERLPDSADEKHWVVEAKPSFSIYPDQTRLLLDNTLQIIDPAGGVPPFDATVRVLSAPRVDAFAADDDGAQLKIESARLLAHSIAVALLAAQQRAAAPMDEIPYRTHRYLDGAREGFERAQLIGRGCARIVLRTLRGQLLSVPVRAEPAGSCADDPYRLLALEPAGG